MKTLTAIALFTLTAAAAAQTFDPARDLAAVVAVEEQEHDLGKAEKLYGELLRSGKLDRPNLILATVRFGRLQQRLGREQAAKDTFAAALGLDGDAARAAMAALMVGQEKEQDPERVKAMRGKAREIVARVMKQEGIGADMAGVGRGIADQQGVQDLLWIGDSAVPEIVAALGEASGREELVAFVAEQTARVRIPSHLGGLAGLLWKIGGPAAVAFFRGVAAYPDLRWRREMTCLAGAADRADMLEVAQTFLRDADPEVRVQSQLPLQRFDIDAIVSAAEAGTDALRTLVLSRLGFEWGRFQHRPDSEATVQRLLPMLEKALVSTDPALGRAAAEFLQRAPLAKTPDGLALLLRELTRSRTLSWPSLDRTPAPAEVATLLPLAVQAARALGGNRGSPGSSWLSELVARVCRGCPAADAEQVLQLLQLGYGDAVALLLVAKALPPTRARDVLAVWRRVNDYNLLDKLPVAPDVWPWFRDYAAQLVRDKVIEKEHHLAAYAVRIGNPEVADWLMGLWAADPQPDHAESRLMSMIELGRLCKDERVRAAIVALARQLHPHNDASGCNKAFLALASMGDLRAFELFPTQYVQTVHPFAKPENPSVQLTAFQYLVYRDQDPPIGFTTAQVLDGLRGLYARKLRLGTPNAYTLGLIPDEVLGEIVRQELQAPGAEMQEWLALLPGRIAAKGAGTDDLRHWYEKSLADPGVRVRRGLLHNLTKELTVAFRAAVEARLADADDECAQFAASNLIAAGIANDVAWLERLRQSPHEKVRIVALEAAADLVGDQAATTLLPCLRDASPVVRSLACTYFGRILRTDAVPELLALMRDRDEGVAKAATAALAAIRLYHDQQSHWDRILKGLDASPGTAAEKLLLQAKPGAGREQRLLAIRSLAALAAPESLPFLIDWIGDPDAEIAAAARAAVTAIHQKAGVK